MESSSGELLEAAWGLKTLSWRAVLEALGEPWGHLGRAGDGLGGVLGGAGAVQEASKRRLEGSLGRLGAVLGALETMLEPSGGQKAPQIDPQKLSLIHI